MSSRKLLFVFSFILVLSMVLAGCGTPATETAAPEAPAAAAPTTAPAAEAPAAAAPTTAPAAEAPTEAPAAEASTEPVILNASTILNALTPNFNPFTNNPNFPTVHGIFESLMIYNTLKSEMVPWLADSYTWSEDFLTLTFKLHEGVKWSDGEPFTAQDVVYTFDLLKNTQGLNGSGLKAVTGPVTAVTAPDDQTVVFTFSGVNTEVLYDIIQQDIVPEHIWKDVADPTTWTNEKPVATGPFTEVTDFQSQVYQIDKNPNYWQEGKPTVDAVRVTAYSGNEAQVAAFIDGQLDWAGTVLPNVDEAIVAHNPNISYVFPPATNTVLLNLNTTVKPFDDPIVRKAMSMAINRDQINEVAFNGLAFPSDVTGISDAYKDWKVADPAALGDWTTYNPEKAAQMLEDAGYKLGADGFRTNKDGSPMAFKLTMVQGFTDWISAGETMIQNWQDIGMNVETNMIDAGAYFGSIPMGDYQIALWFGWNSPTPYNQFMNTMSTATVAPVGQFSMVNFAKFGSPEADALLAEFAGTADLEAKKQAGYKLQELFAQEAPVVPLWAGNDWAIFNNEFLTGWPTPENDYSYAFPNGSNTPEMLLVLLTVGAK